GIFLKRNIINLPGRVWYTRIIEPQALPALRNRLERTGRKNKSKDKDNWFQIENVSYMSLYSSVLRMDYASSIRGRNPVERYLANVPGSSVVGLRLAEILLGVADQLLEGSSSGRTKRLLLGYPGRVHGRR
ncbi:hypothetical protein L9F63_023397, partial [Diploptera punctata]